MGTGAARLGVRRAQRCSSKGWKCARGRCRRRRSSWYRRRVLGRLQSTAASAAASRLRLCNYVATVANREGEVVEEVEGDERSELVWRMKRGELTIYNGGRGQGAAARSTMARALRRARGVGEGAALFSVSRRSFWRQRRGWAVPNFVGRVRASARQWRDVCFVSGDGGRGSATRRCLRGSWCSGASLGERGGPGVVCSVGATCARGGLRRAHSDLAVHVLAHWVSWARSGLGRVVLLSANGEYRHAQ
jgi:hypothetical protein